MNTYIEVKTLLDWFDKEMKESDEQQKKVLAKLVKRIIHQPKTELVQQKTAEWKTKGSITFCGNCKQIGNSGRYCSNCGAKMEM